MPPHIRGGLVTIQPELARYVRAGAKAPGTERVRPSFVAAATNDQVGVVIGLSDVVVCLCDNW
jgi:hypothetical protein